MAEVASDVVDGTVCIDAARVGAVDAGAVSVEAVSLAVVVVGSGAAVPVGANGGGTGRIDLLGLPPSTDDTVALGPVADGFISESFVIDGTVGWLVHGTDVAGAVDGTGLAGAETDAGGLDGAVVG